MKREPRIAANLNTVHARIAAAAAAAGRVTTDVRLIAVSKKFGPEVVQAAVVAGLIDLGENKVQEALHKQAATGVLPVTWHLIGHLQSNKARKAAEAFDWHGRGREVAQMPDASRVRRERPGWQRH